MRTADQPIEARHADPSQPPAHACARDDARLRAGRRIRAERRRRLRPPQCRQLLGHGARDRHPRPERASECGRDHRGAGRWPAARRRRRGRGEDEGGRLSRCQELALWRAGQNVWYGLSLGSVLLLAAIGLAITFGVMGVINMAHGEMVMLGAYTTFVVQEVIRARFPGLFDWSLAIAMPLAFLVAARSASRSSAASSASSMAGRWKRCSPPGACPDPAAGGAHHLRADQSRGRQPVLDVGRLRTWPALDHLEPACGSSVLRARVFFPAARS
jgi:hypothetical protein